jgi:hypothetical protein
VKKGKESGGEAGGAGNFGGVGASVSPDEKRKRREAGGGHSSRPAHIWGLEDDRQVVEVGRNTVEENTYYG